MRVALHIALHVLVPGALAGLWWRRIWWRAFAILLAANLIDLDHLLATPVFDPNRCSVGFHPLHDWPALAIYVLLLVPSATRILAVGLLAHLALDGIDCAFMG